jgi:hypothetical protein
MRASPLLLLALAAGGPAGAQAPTPEPQRGGTYVEPPARVDPIYVPRGPNQPGEPLSADSTLALRLSLDVPLRAAERGLGRGAQGPRPGAPTAQALLRWRPLADGGWFAQATLFRYLEAGRQRPWDPDFTYALGYDDGQPGRWSIVYANYTGTRFSPDRAAGESRFNVPQGQWTASYRFELAEPLQRAVLVGDGDRALCHADGNWVPRFTRQEGGALGHHKTSLALGCRYQRPEGWFAHATAFAWPDPDRQQPWDPDYTYGFGWAQPGERGLAVQYGNYSGNRWPGRDRAPGEGALRSGSVTVTWGTDW